MKFLVLALCLVPVSAFAQADFPTLEPNTLADQIGRIVAWVLTVSGGAAWLAASLSDKGWFQAVMPFINLIGGNVGQAKNDASAQK